MDGVTEVPQHEKSALALLEGLSADHVDEVIAGSARAGADAIKKLRADYEAMKAEVLSLQELNRRLQEQKDLRQRELERISGLWTEERERVAHIARNGGAERINEILDLVTRPR